MRWSGLALAFACLGQVTRAADPSKKSTAVPGLSGPVHTQLVRVTKLGPDPRQKAQIFIWSPTPWLALDRNGNIVEQANELAADGSPINVSYSRFDAAGHQLEWTDSGPSQNIPWHNEFTFGPFGPVEVRTYHGEELTYR